MLSPLSVSNLPAIKINGEWRVLACIPETEESKNRFPKFASSFRNANGLDPSQWQEIDYSWHNIPVMNQSSLLACVGFGSTSAIEMCYVQSGRKLVELNPLFLYALINGGRDAGAMISDALDALVKYGVCEKEVLPMRLMFKNNLTQASYDNAKKYQITEAFQCESYEDICSAISLGFCGALGIMVGSNFGNLDSEGVSPLPGGGGGGHCLHFCGLKKSSRYGWIIKLKNSWGNWGQNGYCYIRKEHFRGMPPDAFAIQMVEVDDTKTDPTEVPVVR